MNDESQVKKVVLWERGGLYAIGGSTLGVLFFMVIAPVPFGILGAILVLGIMIFMPIRTVFTVDLAADWATFERRSFLGRRGALGWETAISALDRVVVKDGGDGVTQIQIIKKDGHALRCESAFSAYSGKDDMVARIKGIVDPAVGAVSLTDTSEGGVSVTATSGSGVSVAEPKGNSKPPREG